ncbi:MAG TPA: hypothetical protein VKS19_01430, partial [Verrucomicrobiae bacterium]|nr:hypothetical protein [Verrucomicrobiae bacterium]
FFHPRSSILFGCGFAALRLCVEIRVHRPVTPLPRHAVTPILPVSPPYPPRPLCEKIQCPALLDTERFLKFRLTNSASGGEYT